MTSSFDPAFQADGMENSFREKSPYRPYVFKQAEYYEVGRPDMSDFDTRVEKPEPAEEKDGAPAEAKKSESEAEAEKRKAEALKYTKQEAERILNEAREEAERIRETAKQEGFREGLDRGHEEGLTECTARYEQEIKKFHADAQQALATVEETKDRIIGDYIGELRDIAVNVAEKVIHVSLQSSGRVIEKMISEEAESHRKTDWLKIYIDKEDYNLLAKTDADMAEELSRITDNIRFVVMDGEKEGYLVMESPEEIVDMSVETQMKNIRDKLRGVLIGNRGDTEDV